MTFFKSLSDPRPDGLILAGINTPACIRVSAVDAYQRDWKVIVAADCVGSYDAEHHEVPLRYMNGKIASVMSNEAVREMLDAAE
jgi:isochorismate hydrolase